MTGGARRDDAILADIGGTSARVALFRGGALDREVRHLIRDYESPVALLRAALSELGAEAPPATAILALAGPVEAGRVTLTNASWRFTDSELAEAFGFERVELLNDFAAIAWALPDFDETDLLRVGGGTAEPGAPMAVLGPGTGLGVAGFVPGPGGPTVLTTEGGHVSLAPDDGRESRLLDALRRRFGHVSAERVLSGDGLVRLYEALAEIEGRTAPPRGADAITRGAVNEARADCRDALETFCAMLGGFAGNLALSLGARGGVFIAGGIVPRFPEFLAASRFRARFEDKGRMAAYLARIPTALILSPEPAFVGLARLAREVLGSASLTAKPNS